MLFKKEKDCADFSNRDIRRVFVSGLMIGVSVVFILNGLKAMIVLALS
ncbi:hypothetical protein HHX48_08240 [Salinimonas sp. HHU 13199]|uniref:DUF2970 domain-containing protein n=1 Tax=Salinimonas profundi TaxID=2729140 RepID=A0ABR8LHK4_9ALTE|nr:hypothetical protein [Salinimonas profundi]MBD3585719.1 hypothetical protein [Salinimonas profundi]